MENGSNIQGKATLQHIISRRDFLRGLGACAGGLALSTALKGGTALASQPDAFTEIEKNLSDTHVVAENHLVDIVIRWGDALDSGAAFDPAALTSTEQATRFGFNNDYIAFMPLPRGSKNSRHGLLCVNHEYTTNKTMFAADSALNEAQQVATEMQAHGCSIVEVKQQGGTWGYIKASPHNHRITTTTPMRFDGAAAGHPLLQTSYDKEGMHPIGTLANCAGGVTPWGTVLTCEENFDCYFDGTIPDELAADYERYGICTRRYYRWHKHDDRFDVSKEPHEPNRFGWVVEYDPYDPDFVPVKHTALGRFKHECASTVLNEDGRVVVYSGDDEVFEYIYRFVSSKPYDPAMSAAEASALLQEGELSVAIFEEDGSLLWMPLVYDMNGLNEDAGFSSQADVLIYARKAADVVGATPMDRPEDVEVNPVTGSVYASLTKNSERSKPNAANNRAANPYGHILEMIPPRNAALAGRDHTARRYRWDIFLKGGNPEYPDHKAYYMQPVSSNGWLTNPDNIAFDKDGRIWICTDGQESSINVTEGLYVAECKGAHKGQTRLFFTAPTGAEITGPAFTPDSKTLFLSIQHPAEDSSFASPATRWPDFNLTLPPRPSVIAITHKQGKQVGSG